MHSHQYLYRLTHLHEIDLSNLSWHMQQLRCTCKEIVGTNTPVMPVTEHNALCMNADTQHIIGQSGNCIRKLCCADGLLVMHNGKVVHEYLLEGVPTWRTHGINSASKVFTGCVAAILADQGKLSWDKPLHQYALQLKGTGEPLQPQASRYNSAAVQHVYSQECFSTD